MTFGDDRPFEWERVFAAMTVPRHEDLLRELRQWPLEVVASDNVARTRTEVDQQVDRLVADGAEAFLAHTPCWAPPNLVVRGVQRAGLPTALVSNRDPSTHGMVGLLGAGGALDQLGWPHIRVREELGGRARERLLPFARAAAVVRRLRGSSCGLFGGRSLGIDTGSVDPMQWRRLFGVDVQTFDQLEIVRRADGVEGDRVAAIVDWLEETAASIAYDCSSLTPERLELQVRCYLATLDLVDEQGLDFAAVKCMPELSTDFVPQCLSACLLPMGTPAVAGEAREPFMLACEADADGALTMQMLKLASQGTPAFFADVSYIIDSGDLLCLPNCGAFCGWYAARSDDAARNMGAIELRPANRKGGGATTYFRAAAGPVTLARLARKDGRYHLLVAPGEIVTPAPETTDLFDRARSRLPLPTAFVRLRGDPEELVQQLSANHISGVAGDVTETLTYVAQLCDIPIQTLL